jgi:hypothetical protein
LLGSVALSKSTFEVDITLTSNNVKIVNVTNDVSCKVYDGENAEPQPCPNSTTQNSPNPSTQNSPNPKIQNSPNSTTQNNSNPTTRNHPNPTTQNEPNPTTQNTPNPTTQNTPNPTTQHITPKPGKLLGSSEDANPRDKGKNSYYAPAY